MSFHRVVFVALATLFTVGMTSMASAGCCDWGYDAPVAYAQVAPVGYGGCGGCGAPTAAVAYSVPVAPAPPDTAYAPAANYPYVPGYGYGPAPVAQPYYNHLYYHPHYTDRAPMYRHYGLR